MKINPAQARIYLFAVISMLCWSLSFIWTRIALQSFPPVMLVAIRLLLASILLYVFLKASRRFMKIRRADMKLFLLLSFFEPFLYYIGETYGLTMVKPTLASVIVATIPVFAPAFAFVFLKERFTFINVAGILISILGVCLIVNKVSSDETTSAAGIGLVFMAVFSAIIYGLILRKIPKHYTATNIIFYQSLLGLIYFIPASLIVDLKHISSYTIHPESIKAILMLTVFASVIAFVLFANVVRTIGITKSQVFTNLIPVFTALFSWILFKEMMSFVQWFGIFIVILGVFISQSPVKFRQKAVEI